MADYANGAFLAQKRAKSGQDPDSALESDVQFSTGGEDAGSVSDNEALGARHRRNVGYTSEGAQEHDIKLERYGHKPGRIIGHKRKQYMGESRIGHFGAAITATKRPTSLVEM